MGKLEMVDECMDRDKFVRLNYDGPNPFNVVKKVGSSIKPFFHISSSSTGQPVYNIDNSSDPFTFYSEWWGKLSMSAYSSIRLYFKVRGAQSKKDKTGNFQLQVWGDLETKFSGRNILLKPFYLMYSYLFYDRVRRGYIAKCKSLMLNFRNYMKDYYNVGKTDVQTEKTGFG